MNERTTDIIRWVIDRMLAHDDSITQELALTVEREARIEWGGDTVYIAKTCGADMPDPKAVLQDYVLNKPVGEITRRHGISRAYLYKVIKQR